MLCTHHITSFVTQKKIDMKQYSFSIALFLFILLSFTVSAQDKKEKDDKSDAQYEEYLNEVDTTSAGSNLDLQAVAEIFRTSKDLEEFEKRINEKDEGVNNLDLNGDGKVDYLRVLDRADGNTHVIVIQAVLGKDKFQDVASIDVVQKDNKVTLQLVGDEDIYGTEYYLEPEDEEEVKNYPSVQFIFHVGYTPYYSPYYWGYYPPFFRPWPPFPPYYYHRHVYRHYYHHHHHHYHHGHRPMHPHARNMYYGHRSTAPVRNPNYAKPGTRPNRPSNPGTRPGNKPGTKPSTRPSTKPSTRPSTKPATRPSTRPSTQPSTRPSTRPSQNPAASRPSTRPSQNPAASRPSTRPSTRPSQNPAASRPSTRPSTRPSQNPAASRPSTRPSSRPSSRPSGSYNRAPRGSYGGGASRARSMPSRARGGRR
jgi:outer membrane biosynthesis protein TonB